MGGIVSAVRGGPDSQASVSRAIALANETGLPLYFLYVVNLDFLSSTTSTRVHTISEEMHQMGEFILVTAQAAAAAQGVEAQGVVRQGQVSEEIIGLCHELGADYLVLGQPQFHEEASVFDEALLAVFVEAIEKQTGAKVVLSEGAES